MEAKHKERAPGSNGKIGIVFYSSHKVSLVRVPKKLLWF